MAAEPYATSNVVNGGVYPPEPKFCDFCGKLREEVAALIAGGTAAICDECIGQATEMLSRALAKALLSKPTNPETDCG